MGVTGGLYFFSDKTVAGGDADTAGLSSTLGKCIIAVEGG
jgi:hypothetical protein